MFIRLLPMPPDFSLTMSPTVHTPLTSGERTSPGWSLANELRALQPQESP